MFENIKKAGCDTVVVSGFRGNDELIDKMNLKEKLNWSLRIKLITKDLGEYISEAAKRFNLCVMKRVSCGVGMIFQSPSHNPYQYSSSLLGCENCNLYTKGICLPSVNIDEKEVQREIDALKEIGFNLKLSIPSKIKMCCVTPDNREKCPSCCTACYITKVPKILIQNQDITLADTAFIRFFTGLIGTKHGIEDLGGDTAIVKTIKRSLGVEVHLVNTWWVMANELSKCFGCKYCITGAYTLTQREYGIHPMELFKKIESKINE